MSMYNQRYGGRPPTQQQLQRVYDTAKHNYAIEQQREIFEVATMGGSTHAEVAKIDGGIIYLRFSTGEAPDLMGGLYSRVTFIHLSGNPYHNFYKVGESYFFGLSNLKLKSVTPQAAVATATWKPLNSYETNKLWHSIPRQIDDVKAKLTPIYQRYSALKEVCKLQKNLHGEHSKEYTEMEEAKVLIERGERKIKTLENQRKLIEAGDSLSQTTPVHVPDF